MKCGHAAGSAVGQQMTTFTQLSSRDGTLVDFETQSAPPAKRPSQMVAEELAGSLESVCDRLGAAVLAGTFGGLRIYSSAIERVDLQRAADRAEMVPAIVSYMAALNGAMVAGTEGGDTQAALTEYDTRKSELNQRLTATDVVPDVRLAANTLLDYGQDLVNKVMSNSIDLRTRVTTYTPLLLTSETAITGRCGATNRASNSRRKRCRAPSAPAARWPWNRCWSIAAASCPNRNCARR